MNGIPAYNMAGLRANFAGSDILVDTDDPRRKLLVQVKTGYCPVKDQVYLTQCAGTDDLEKDKFVSDFVVFVNIDRKVGRSHSHDGTLGFEHLRFFVVPRDLANMLYKRAVRQGYELPKKDGTRRSLNNMAVNVPIEDLAACEDAWHLIRSDSKHA